LPEGSRRTAVCLTLRGFIEAYQEPAGGIEPFGAFLARYPELARSFSQSAQDRATLLARAASLVELAQAMARAAGDSGKQASTPEDGSAHHAEAVRPRIEGMALARVIPSGAPSR
jgi:hypothetical protein